MKNHLGEGTDHLLYKCILFFRDMKVFHYFLFRSMVPPDFSWVNLPSQALIEDYRFFQAVQQGIP